MHQWTGSALLHIMACRLFHAKLLPESMLDYCQLDPQEQTSMNFFYQNRKCFIHENACKDIVCEMMVILSRGTKIKFKPFLTLRCDGWYKVWWYLMLHGELRVYFPGGTERVGLDWWELEIRNNVHKNREQAQLRKWWQEFASLPYDIVTCVRLHTEISDANVNNIATIQISHDFL